MAWRTLLFAMVLLAGVCAPVAQAQLGRILISGIVPCSNSTKTSTVTTPVFPNALVQLLCGGSVVSSATTNDDGVFSMPPINLVATILSTLLNDCKLAVGTPLSTCDASLPSDGFLQSALQVLGGLIGGILGGTVFNIIPVGFNLVH